jgi:hypothetical protein
MNSLNEPIDILEVLLRKWSIECIISIDDGWKANTDESDEVLFDLLLENHIDITEEVFKQKDSFVNYEDVEHILDSIDLDDFQTKYLELEDADKEKINNILIGFNTNQTEFVAVEQSLLALSKSLEDLKGRGFDVKIASEFNQSLKTDLKGRTLWLLDKEVRGDSTKVFEVLELVVEREDVALIVTNNDANLSSRSEISEFVKNNFSKYQNLATSFLWVLRKDQISSNLMVSLKNVLQGFSLHNTLKIYRELHKKAESIAEERLRFIEPEDMDNYFKSSYSEGSQLSDTLIRIRNAVFSESLHEIITNEPEYTESLLSNRELLENLITTLTIPKESDSYVAAGDSGISLVNLTQEHKIVPIHSFEQWEYNLNSLANCINTGDLFVKTNYDSRNNKWNPSKTVFLLITQPCDTVLRLKNGTIQRGTKVANLIKGEFLEYGTPKYRRNMEGEHSNKLKVHFGRLEGKYGMIMFDLKNIYQIDFKILDLCALDPNGEALLNLDNLNRTKYMSGISKSYYDLQLNDFITKMNQSNNASVERQFNKYLNNKITIEDLKNFIQKELNKVLLSNEIMIPKEFEFIQEKGFSVSRIARLNDEYIINVIRQSTDYQGRQALPGIML